MRIRSIIRIFALLFLASCVEVTISVFSPCQRMTFSDALPVQFWLSDCDTYNETVPKGVHEACFCQPWQCDDEIKVQFQAEEVSPEATYYLIAKDGDGSILAAIEIDEIETGLYAASIIPEDEDIFDEILSNPNFEGSLSPWENTGSGTSWIWDASGAAKFSFTDGENSKSLRQSISTQQPGTYYVEIKGRFTVSSVTGTLTLAVAQGFSSYVFHQQSVTGTDLITITLPNEDISSLGEFDEIRASLTGLTSGIAGDFIIESYRLVSIGDDLAKSDCLHIATTQDETELLEYSNGRNFAGLIYQDLSPDPASFYLRVPCRFFHEQFPEEDEAIELTSQVVTTSAQLKSQKLLEVQHVPYYFHKKLQLVLKHQSLTIGGKDYKKEEKYEINIGNKKWPLKSATCLLTEKSSVIRNVL
jgi:hypothetical protein